MTMIIPSDAAISKLLKDVHVFAIVGASAKVERPSFKVMSFLLSKGYHVIPVNPMMTDGDILGQKVYRALSEVPAPVDVVDFFRSSEAVLEDVRAAIKEKDRLGIKCIWMQLGVFNETAAFEAAEAGAMVVMDRCPKIEWSRLF